MSEFDEKTALDQIMTFFATKGIHYLKLHMIHEPYYKETTINVCLTRNVYSKELKESVEKEFGPLGYFFYWCVDSSESLIQPNVGDFVIIYGGEFNDELDAIVIGIVVSKIGSDDGTTYGISHVFDTIKDGKTHYSFSVTEENYGGYYKGVDAILTKETFEKILNTRLDKNYEEAKNEVDEHYKRCKRRLPELVDFLANSKQTKAIQSLVVNEELFPLCASIHYQNRG